MQVTLDQNTPNKTIDISITDDTELEGTEYFTLRLNFTGGVFRRLNLCPSTAIVKILDNDSKHYSFIPVHGNMQHYSCASVCMYYDEYSYLN